MTQTLILKNEQNKDDLGLHKLSLVTSYTAT